MTPGDQQDLPESVRTAILSRHPGIADDIQGAIDTLRKLQQIAGSSEAAPPAGEPSVTATTDSSPAPDDTDAKSLTDAGEPPAAARPAPPLAAGNTFGRYQIVRLLGRGAMGSVYLAYDSNLQRHVALKTPTLGGPQSVGRFVREARAAAGLRNPHLCPVYDVGQIGGVHYLTMAFIDGRPLSRAIAEGRLGDGRAVAGLTRKIARGLQKAHEQGVIHRDLKPDNIMLDADGEPVVMDFGLARRVDEDVRLTAAGRILGTPAYMSPEQIDGDPRKIGPATDVYSLGVVLYEMLTGRTPFQGSFTGVLRQIASEAPPRPSSVNPALGAGSPLERICLRMMAKSPADRYAGMAGVSEALDEAFPRELPPAARPSPWRSLLSWAASLLAPRPGAPTPAEGAHDRTLVGAGRAGPAGKKDRRSGDETLDLPRHDA
jgi:serine/threonine protein kinase